MTPIRAFKDLDLSSAFLFSAVMEDAYTCQNVLQIILGFPIAEVAVRSERSVLYSSDFRSVRLDAYAYDKFRVSYNVEMQQKNEKNLPKRSRFHQAEMDATALRPGEGFNDLRYGYVIFINTFDPFGLGRYRYIFENRCLEHDIPLCDDTRKVFLSTKGTFPDDVSSELIYFLKYVENSTEECAQASQNPAIMDLHAKITTLKQNRELEEKYMMIEELLKDREEEGEARGEIRGEIRGEARGEIRGEARGEDKGTHRTLDLINAMLKDARAMDIPRLKNDRAFYQEMLKAYHVH